MTAPLEIDNPFWRFSLRVYAATGVQQECLAVQDTLGVDVNVLLFAAWLGAKRGVVLEEADLLRIRDAAARWSDEIVQPLRSVRRRLKLGTEIADDNVQALRKRVAETELFAEQIEQALLYGMSAEFSPSGDGSEAAARSNIAAVLAASVVERAAPAPSFDGLLAASMS